MPKRRAARRWTEDHVLRLTLNPTYAVNIHPMLSLPKEQLIDRVAWIAANKKLIREVGVDRWLATLLEVLEGRYVTGGPDGPEINDPDDQ
jgi:hypothetical protein